MTSVELLGLVGLLLGTVFVIVMIYKGWSLPVTMIVGSIIILVFNQMNLAEGFGNMIEGLGTMCKVFMPVYLFGCILATLYMESGACTSLAYACMHLFARNRSEKGQRLVAIIIILITGALIDWTINSFFLHAAICIGLMVVNNIPRKYVVVFTVLGATLGRCFPGHMSMNVMANRFLPEAGVLSGFGAGVIGTILLLISGTFLLYRSVEKDIAKGEKFEYGPLQPVKEGAEKDYSSALAALSLAPIIVMVVLYLGLGFDAWVAVAIGCIVAFVCFFKWLPMADQENRVGMVRRLLDTGTRMAAMPCIMIFNSTLGFAIAPTPGFAVLTRLFQKIPGPRTISFALFAIFMIGLASGSGGMVSVMQTAHDVFVPAGVPTEAARLICLYASTVLDSLPTNISILSVAMWGGLTIKESYKPVFTTTVVLTFVNTILISILLNIPALCAAL